MHHGYYRSHFGSRYKLGCCGHAGLFYSPRSARWLIEQCAHLGCNKVLLGKCRGTSCINRNSSSAHAPLQSSCEVNVRYSGSGMIGIRSNCNHLVDSGDNQITAERVSRMCGKYEPGRTRACNLWFRRPTPHPLGHRAACCPGDRKQVFESRNLDHVRASTLRDVAIP